MNLMPGKIFFFRWLACLLVIGFMELCGGLILKVYPSIAVSRDLLMGRQLLDAGLNSVPQAFLLYIPRPNLESDGFLQHNSQGYRGELVPQQRQPDTVRILFMGGSTTYGEGVSNPEHSYPAQLGKIIQQNPAWQGKRVEIINAGLRGGTAAEILTHYLLKYRYYHPDIAVINPGGNDPVAYVAPNYHPDYSNIRQSPEEIKPLRIQSRWMLHSRFLSVVVVTLFFPDLSQVTSVVTPYDKWTTAIPAKWFVAKKKGELQKKENAFYNDISTVVREMKQEGTRVFLLSYQGNPFDKQDQSFWRQCYDYEESLLKIISEEQGVSYAPFPLDMMPESVWVDASHLNEAGEAVKARYVSRHLERDIDALYTQGQAALDAALADVGPALHVSRDILPAFPVGLRE